MVNFHGPESVPSQFKDRTFYQHNPTVTLMRTTAEENRHIGIDIGEKLAKGKGSAVVMLPLHGVSAIDRVGQPFDDPAARTALFDAIEQSSGAVEIERLDHHINDPEFAEAMARRLIALMRDERFCR